MLNSIPESAKFPVVRRSGGHGARGQVGASLIVVMIIIVIVSVLGISGAQIALMSEHSARNDRDYQVAFQSAETALYDATNDMEGAVDSESVGTTPRAAFTPGNKLDFLEGCGTSGTSKGLCAPEISEKTRPIWMQVDFTSGSSPTAEFGDFTGRKFDAGGATGIRPARKPRYLIEVIEDRFTVGREQALDPGQLQENKKLLYRVTTMGFGPRVESQAVVQMLYAKE